MLIKIDNMLINFIKNSCEKDDKNIYYLGHGINIKITLST